MRWAPAAAMREHLLHSLDELLAGHRLQQIDRAVPAPRFLPRASDPRSR